MKQSVGIGKGAFADLSGFPGVRRGVEGHIDHNRRTDILARDATPEAAVVGVSAIVTHHEITVFRDFVGAWGVPVGLYPAGAGSVWPTA